MASAVSSPATGEGDSSGSGEDRDGITLESLQKLQRFFGKDRALNETEFVEKLGGVLGRNLSKEKLTHLFMKIDVNSDGTVDWDEFTNFMFLDNKDTGIEGDVTGDSHVQFVSVDEGVMDEGVRAATSSRRPIHRDGINKLMYIAELNQLVSCSGDGIVCTWNSTSYSLHRRMQTILAKNVRIADAQRRRNKIEKLKKKAERDRKRGHKRHTAMLQQPSALVAPTASAAGSQGQAKQVTDYLTDAVYMSFCGRMAVASVDTSVVFYDHVSSPVSVLGKIPSVDLRQAAPLSLGYHHDAAHGKELLFIGDDSGAVSMYNFTAGNWHMCDGSLPCHNTLEAYPVIMRRGEQGMLNSGVVTHRRALHELAGAIQPVRLPGGDPRAHTDHVVQVNYVPDLNSIVTASLDTTCNVIDLERMTLKRKFDAHQKAVYSFAWCSHSKVVASCGLEHNIYLWSPYSERVVGTLTGHSSAVRKVVYNDQDNKLISLGADNTVKVWDVRNARCIQTMTDAKTWAMGGAGDLNDIVFDSHRKRLVGGCTKLRAWVLKSVKSSARSTTHDSGVVRALFNRGFNQVVSGDTRGMVRVWDVNTGRSVSKFQVESENASDDSRPKPGAGSTTNNAAKGAGTTLTAMAFDQGGRRLITGTHDGKELQVWNFSNGCLLTTLQKQRHVSPDEAHASTRSFSAQPAKHSLQDVAHDDDEREARRNKARGGAGAAGGINSAEAAMLLGGGATEGFTEAAAGGGDGGDGGSGKPISTVRSAFGSTLPAVVQRFDFGLPRRAGAQAVVAKVKPHSRPDGLLVEKGGKEGGAGGATTLSTTIKSPSHVHGSRRGTGGLFGASSKSVAGSPSRAVTARSKARRRRRGRAVPHSPMRSATGLGATGHSLSTTAWGSMQSLTTTTGAGAGAGAGAAAPRVGFGELGVTLPSPSAATVLGQTPESIAGTTMPSPLQSARNADGEAVRPWGTVTGTLLGSADPSGAALALNSAKLGDTRPDRVPETRAGEVTAIEYCVHTLPRIRGQAAVQNKFVVSVGWDRTAFVWKDIGSFGKHQGYVMRIPGHGGAPHDEERDVHAGTGTAGGAEGATDGISPGNGTTGTLSGAVGGMAGDDAKSATAAAAAATAAARHTDDVLCTAFCPPSVLATGGYDGMVLMWNINSSDLHASFDTGSPVEALKFSSVRAVLIVATADATLFLLDPREGTALLSTPAAHWPGASVTSLALDAGQDHLFTGDSAGCIKVWDLAWNTSYGLHDITFWRAHHSSITSIDYVEVPMMMETFCVTAAANGEVLLWTLGGALVGMFGQAQEWNLRNPATYRSSDPAPRPTFPATVDGRTDAETLAALSGGHAQSGLARRASRRSSAVSSVSASSVWSNPGTKSNAHSVARLASRDVLAQHHSLIPSNGEVWVKTDLEGHKVAVITVTRVDETLNVVEGFDGTNGVLAGDMLQQLPMLKLKCIEEFVEDSPIHSWAYNSRLTQRVGRIFMDRARHQPYKVLFARYAAPHGWMVVDLLRREHAVPPLPVRHGATRSMSVFLMREAEIAAAAASPQRPQRSPDAAAAGTSAAGHAALRAAEEADTAAFAALIGDTPSAVLRAPSRGFRVGAAGAQHGVQPTELPLSPSSPAAGSTRRRKHGHSRRQHKQQAGGREEGVHMLHDGDQGKWDKLSLPPISSRVTHADLRAATIKYTQRHTRPIATGDGRIVHALHEVPTTKRDLREYVEGLRTSDPPPSLEP